MKKLFLISIILLTVSTSYSQIVFNETFDNISGTTSGGAGTYAFPNGWTLVNVDNRTPDPSVSYVNNAWIRREDFSTNVNDSAAFSTSYYSPVGAADDWMWTPLIASIPSNAQLSWNAITYDAGYRDGYEVRVMTVAPTGTSGNLGNMVSSSSLIFSTVAENAVWTPHTVSLAAYAGQNIYIGFRNNSNDKFILLIDDIVIGTALNYDANLISKNTLTEYTQTPLNQSTPLSFSGAIKNSGAMTLTNVNLNVSVLDASNTEVYAASGAPVTILTGDTATFTVPDYTLTQSGNYTVKYFVSCTETDELNTNDTLISTLTISDTVYARDNGVVSGSLGIGAGNGGYLGQDFLIQNSADLTSVTVEVNRGYTGKNLALAVWNMSAGIPNAIIAYTDTILYPDDSARVYTIPIDGGNFALTPGRYAVTAIEFDSTLAVALTDNIFTLGTTWVNWPTSPLGTWGNNEDFGTGFQKAYGIRMNFASTCNLVTLLASGDVSCNGANDGFISLSPTGGVSPYAFAWTPNVSSTQSAGGLAPGNYEVIVTDNVGCSGTYNFTINEPAPIDVSIAAIDLTISALSAVGTFQWIDCNSGQAIPNATSSFFEPNVDGRYAVVVTVGTCTDTSACVNIIGVGINAPAQKELVVYPNPSSGNLSITSVAEGIFTIYNNLGQPVRTVNLTAKNRHAMQIDDLTNGVYTISGVSQGKTIKQTIIIQK